MAVEKIYIVRHGFRGSWSVDPLTGSYSSSFPSPTGIPVDPALTAHGVSQAAELSRHLTTLDPPVDAIYSSPYFRCLQTLTPFVDEQRRRASSAGGSRASSGWQAARIRADPGLGEWFGAAPFAHPGPASAETLRTMFPAWDETYVPVLAPATGCGGSHGETPAQLQRRVAETLRGVVERCDAEGSRAVLLCTHAAVVIMMGRILTGRFPESLDVDDFHAYTCGLSVYRRESGMQIGTWTCEANSDCSFLSGGAERGWSFVGDEEFPGTGSVSQDPAHKL